MLSELYIKNFAIIDDRAIQFGPGYNVLTGETGAGKSIMIQALGLITGDRASSDVIRSGENEAEVTAIFDANKVSTDLLARLAESGLETDGQIVLRRSVSSSGKSRAWLNGRPISLAQLKAISPFLLEISSQHEHQRLLNEEVHLELVDKFGELHQPRENYRSKFTYYIDIKNRLAELERLAASKTEQREFLSFQIKEIGTANLIKGEEEELERERNVIKHAASLFEKLSSSEKILYSSESSTAGALRKVGELLSTAGEIDSEIKEWQTLCDQASVAVDELARNLQNYLDRLDVDPDRLDEIEARLFEIRRLKKKYGGSVEEILQRQENLVQKLDLIDNCDSEIEKLTQELRQARAGVGKLARELSEVRARSADKLSALTQKELNTLGLMKTTFAPGHVRLDVGEAGELGIDRFNFLISPNQGEPLKPLSRIASGGELSRITLAIKSVLMGKVGLASLEVFDEIDVGIGGAVAEVVGRKLREMSKRRQIICITHLPQVASFGDHHIVVSKEVRGKRTVAIFELLNGRRRVDEIARMLGGTKITNTTREHAREMLERGIK